MTVAAQETSQVDLVVVGSYSYDHLSNPVHGEEWSIGGSGAYASLGAALNNARVGWIGFMPVSITDHDVAVIGSKINLAGMRREPDADIRFDIEYDHDWNATYRVDGADPETRLSFADFPAVYEAARGIHLCAVARVGIQLEFVAGIRERGLSMLLSASTARRSIKTERESVIALLQQVELFMLNQEEAMLLTQQFSLEVACHDLERLAPETTICVTRGEFGVIILARGKRHSLPAYLAQVKDTTGAGDTFSGSFAAAYLQSRDISEAAIHGICTASMTVEDWGIHALMRATPADIATRAQHYRKTILQPQTLTG